MAFEAELEAAKSGRAACKKCKEKSIKDEMRLGLQVERAGFTATHWHHLLCAANVYPEELKAAAAEIELTLSAEVKKALSEAKVKKTKTYPYAEAAPSGRAACRMCSEKIAKGTLRVVVEVEIETEDFSKVGSGYLHPKCTQAFTEDATVLETVLVNSELSEEEKVQWKALTA